MPTWIRISYIYNRTSIAIIFSSAVRKLLRTGLSGKTKNLKRPSQTHEQTVLCVLVVPVAIVWRTKLILPRRLSLREVGKLSGKWTGWQMWCGQVQKLWYFQKYWPIRDSSTRLYNAGTKHETDLNVIPNNWPAMRNPCSCLRYQNWTMRMKDVWTEASNTPSWHKDWG